MVRKGNLAVFESSNISETYVGLRWACMSPRHQSLRNSAWGKRSTPTKIGVHVLDINHYLHEFFEPIPIN